MPETPETRIGQASQASQVHPQVQQAHPLVDPQVQQAHPLPRGVLALAQ
jgi:hypothetical protein